MPKEQGSGLPAGPGPGARDDHRIQGQQRIEGPSTTPIQNNVIIGVDREGGVSVHNPDLRVAHGPERDEEGDTQFKQGGLVIVRQVSPPCQGDDSRESVASLILHAVTEAQHRLSSVSGVASPTLTTWGGGSDLWFFSERTSAMTQRDVLWPLYYLCLSLHEQLHEWAAIALTWDNDVAVLDGHGQAGLLSAQFRAAQDVLQGAQPGHLLLPRQICDVLPLKNGDVERHTAERLCRILGIREDRAPRRTGNAGAGRLVRQLRDIRVLTPSKRILDFVSTEYLIAGRRIVGPEHPYVELIPVEHRDLSGSPGSAFIELLAEHEECVIVGVTNENLVRAFLMPALRRRHERDRGFWRRLVVVFPNADDTTRMRDGRPRERRLQLRNSGLRTVMNFLREADGSTRPRRWKVVQYNGNMTFSGTWTNDGPRASIRLAPLLPHKDLKDAFLFQLLEGSVAYDEARASFRRMEHDASMVREWNLCGRVRNDQFHFERIADRDAPTPPSTQRAEAVVLVLVHGLTGEGHRVFLQYRTPDNHHRNLEVYSNISGKVTTEDVPVEASLLAGSGDAVALTMELQKQDILSFQQVLPEQVWRRAAIRELEEELGLLVQEDRLRDHGCKVLHRHRGTDLFFRIFSLELGTMAVRGAPHTEINWIRTHQPDAAMDGEFGINRIRELAADGRVNHLLAENIDFFADLYRELGVVDE